MCLDYMIGHLCLEAAFQHTFSFSFFLPHVSPFLSERTDGVCVCLCVCVCVNVSMSGVNVSVFISLTHTHTHTTDLWFQEFPLNSEQRCYTPVSLSPFHSLVRVVSLCLSLKQKCTHTHIHSRFACVRSIYILSYST